MPEWSHGCPTCGLSGWVVNGRIRRGRMRTRIGRVYPKHYRVATSHRGNRGIYCTDPFHKRAIPRRVLKVRR